MIRSGSTITNSHSPQEKVTQARFSKDGKYIVDSYGNQVNYEDKRIVFVQPAARDPYGKRLVEKLYNNINRNIRIASETTPEVIQYSRKICSGKECLPSVAIAGWTLKDIYENRGKDEVTIYRNPLNQFGPCQNGNWPLLFENYSIRLNMKNILYCVSPSKRNNYLGLGLDFIALEVMLFSVGHVITEIRNALECTAADNETAIKKFEDETTILIENMKDEGSFKKDLKKWANTISKIPLSKIVEETPKVLILGGLNLLFCHYPAEEYFIQNGIIPKVVDISESTGWILSEWAVRLGYKRGIMDPKKQLGLISILAAFLKSNPSEVYKSLQSKIRMRVADKKYETYRKIMGVTGLLFDDPPSFKSIVENSYKYVSHNGFTETSTITGRFVHALNKGSYDGMVNLGCFNCAPAMNSQAIIRPIANKSDVPYVAIDVEGPWLSTNQHRLLETIAVQAKRIREIKNKNKGKP